MAHPHCRLDLGLSLLHISFHHTVEPVSYNLVFLIVFLAYTSYCMYSICPTLPNFRQLQEKKFVLASCVKTTSSDSKPWLKQHL